MVRGTLRQLSGYDTQTQQMNRTPLNPTLRAQMRKAHRTMLMRLQRRWSWTKRNGQRRSLSRAIASLTLVHGLTISPLQVARSQLDKVTAAAHARQKATFNPQLTVNDTAKTVPASKPKRRVSLGVVVDAATGEVMQSGKRHSRRSHTMLATSMSDARLRDELEKQV